MKTALIGLLVVVGMACSSSGPGGVGGGTGGSGGSGGGASSSSWTQMPLLDETTGGGTTRFHSNEDRVTSIFYTSVDTGFVATAAAGQSNQGGLFRASAKKLTTMAIDKDKLDLDSFINIFKTNAGFVATLATAESVVTSTDNGATFAKVRTNLKYGLSRTVVLRESTDGKWTWVGASGVIAESSAPPSMGTVWTELWAPEGIPPTPNPVPATGCKLSPRSQGSPLAEQYVYVSPNRQFIAYAAYTDMADPHQLCISNDGGKSFAPKTLVTDRAHQLPNGSMGVTFISDTVGFVYAGDFLGSGSAYIQKTTDKGVTWTATTLPAEVKGKEVSIRSVFFAPDGVHGFAVGWFANPVGPLVLLSSDSGATWTVSPSLPALKEQMSKDTFGSKLYTGFALDPNHIWVGGERGSLYANEVGGK